MADLVCEALVVDHTGHIKLPDRPGSPELDPVVVARYRVAR
jgi:hypothetical protein